MLTESPQKVEELPDGRILTDEEFLEMKENLARINFGMSLAEFTEPGGQGSSTTTRRDTGMSSAWRCCCLSIGTDDCELALDEDPD